MDTVEHAKQLNLESVFLDQLIKQFGPELAQILIGFLHHKQAVMTAGNGNLANANWVQQFLLQILTTQKAAILGWIEGGEGALLNALFALIGAKNPLIGMLLAQFQGQILAQVNGIDESVLNALIQALQSPQTA